MGQDRVRAALALGAALTLTACGLADSHSALPEIMRAKVIETTPEAPPDVKRLVGEQLDSVFTAAAHAARVQVSPPLRDPRGLGWTACVRAELTSVIGKPLGTQTYRISIEGGVIADRRKADADDTCATETYQPL